MFSQHTYNVVLSVCVESYLLAHFEVITSSSVSVTNVNANDRANSKQHQISLLLFSSPKFVEI